MKKRRAIIFGTGGLCGAFSAGFASELCKIIGPNYFDSIYGVSVGTTIATFFIANQPDIIERTWKNLDKKELIKPYNFLFGKKILDLNYLISIFKNNIAHLKVNRVMKHRKRLKYAVINYDTGKVSWINPDKKNIFQFMKASCSMPIVHGPQKVGNRNFFDAGFVYGGIPEIEKIAKDYDEIIYVSNYPKNYKMTAGWKLFTGVFFPVAARLGYPKPLQKVFKKRKETRENSLKYMNQNKKIKVISPKSRIFKTTFDKSGKKINKMIEIGKREARLFFKSIKN